MLHTLPPASHNSIPLAPNHQDSGVFIGLVPYYLTGFRRLDSV